MDGSGGANRVRGLGRLDPRAKLLLATAAVLAVVSEPRGAVEPFMFYIPMTVALLLGAGVPWPFTARRALAVTPFALVAGALVLITGAGAREMATSLVLRVVTAVALFGVVTGTEPVGRILWSLRACGMPTVVTSLSGFMFRFIQVLGQEARRVETARQARTPGPIRTGRVRTFGQQWAMLFLRGWRRSQTIHQAMAARGFTGAFPGAAPGRLAPAEFGAALLLAGLFVMVRLRGVIT